MKPHAFRFGNVILNAKTNDERKTTRKQKMEHKNNETPPNETTPTETTPLAALVQRKRPGPMDVYICSAGKTTDEDDPKLDRVKFDVLRRVSAGDGPKAVREAIKELGHGTYYVLTGRLKKVTFEPKTIETFKFTEGGLK